jgi:uncharacterized protein YndB with AHSA1/START domain
LSFLRIKFSKGLPYIYSSEQVSETNLKIRAMKTAEKTTVRTTITVGATINAPVKKVWELWTDPNHIIRWCTASDDWHTPRAENDLRTGGRFLSRMEAVNGSMGFDFSGTYSK